MLIGAAMVAFVILGMFFAMLSQSPKSEPEPLPAKVRDRRTQ
jgi:hypothetical protein